MITALQPFLSSASLLALAEFEPESLLLPLLWFSAIILTVVVESQTAELVSIWFAPGAFIAMILAFCEVGIGIQIIRFFGGDLSHGQKIGHTQKGHYRVGDRMTAGVTDIPGGTFAEILIFGLQIEVFFLLFGQLFFELIEL